MQTLENGYRVFFCGTVRRAAATTLAEGFSAADLALKGSELDVFS